MTDQAYDENNDSPDDGEREEISRSEKKRRSTARQKMGEELARLPLATLRGIGLSEAVLTAFAEYHKATQHEARRRQMQFIGRLLRDVDVVAMQLRLEEHRSGHAAVTEGQHRLEALRDTLIEEREGALEALLLEFPHAEVQHVRQLARNARRERDAGKPPRSYRALFRYLRELASQK